MELVADGDLTMLKITPPQTKDRTSRLQGVDEQAPPRSLDTLGGMKHAAVTNDDGDRVSHGWSQLDIAKHATNTFITSLEDDDLVSVHVVPRTGAKTRPRVDAVRRGGEDAGGAGGRLRCAPSARPT